MSTVHIPRAAGRQLGLPRVCVATGATEGVGQHDVTFHFVPLGARLSLAFCGLLGVVVFLVMRERAALSLPFTDAAWAKFRTARTISAVLAGAVVVGVVALVVPLFARMAIPLGLGALLFLAALTAFIVHHETFMRSVGPVCRELTAEHVVLELPSAAAAAAIRDHFGSLVPVGNPTNTERDARDDELDRELRDM